MSAFGPKRTSACALQMSASGGKADMAFCAGPKADIGPDCHSPPGRKVLGFKPCSRCVLRGHMQRRQFIRLLGGATAAWPFIARAQQSDRVRRIGWLVGSADDAYARALSEAFRQGLQQLGWIDGRNVQIDVRFGAGDSVRLRKYAAELIALSPDVILATGGSATQFLLQETRTLPIIFAIVPDPVGSGFVESLSRPGGNASDRKSVV